MRRSILLVLSVLLVVSSFACASKDYVRTQIAPVNQKVMNVERRVGDLEQKVDALERETRKRCIAK